jgi:hypothetical protein
MKWSDGLTGLRYKFLDSVQVFKPDEENLCVVQASL